MAECKVTLATLPDAALPEITALPGDLSLIARVVGVKLTLELVEALRGTYVYFRNLDHLKRQWRDDYIRAEIDRRINAGESTTVVVQDLARSQGLSSRQVWAISGRSGEDDKGPQLKMF